MNIWLKLLMIILVLSFFFFIGCDEDLNNSQPIIPIIPVTPIEKPVIIKDFIIVLNNINLLEKQCTAVKRQEILDYYNIDVKDFHNLQNSLMTFISKYGVFLNDN